MSLEPCCAHFPDCNCIGAVHMSQAKQVQQGQHSLGARVSPAGAGLGGALLQPAQVRIAPPLGEVPANLPMNIISQLNDAMFALDQAISITEDRTYIFRTPGPITCSLQERVSSPQPASPSGPSVSVLSDQLQLQLGHLRHLTQRLMEIAHAVESTGR